MEQTKGQLVLEPKRPAIWPFWPAYGMHNNNNNIGNYNNLYNLQYVQVFYKLDKQAPRIVENLRN